LGMKEHRYKWMLLAVILGLHGLLGNVPQIMSAFGVGRSVVWFRDMHSMLAASDAAHDGLNPYVDNPYDIGRERHIYPDWWFALGQAGLTRPDSYWLGWVVVGLFWLAVLAVVPGRSPGELGWTLLICASPPFWLGVNRANPDLLIFALLTPVVPLLFHHNRWVRLLAPWPVALAAGLKFFPALAGVVFLKPAPSRREGQLQWLLIAALLLFLVWAQADDVQRYLQAGWIARGQFIFGAAAVPLHYGGNPDFWLNAGRVAGAALMLAAFFHCWRQPVVRPGGTEREWGFFIMGAAVLAGGFFLTVGYLYKIVFAVWLLPVLLPLAARSGQPGMRLSLACLAGMVWVEGLVCAALALWPQPVDAFTRILLHRMAAVISGLLAWGFLLPVVHVFGAELRGRWQQWRASHDPA